MRRRYERGARSAIERDPCGDVQTFGIDRHGHRAATGCAQNVIHEPVTWFLNPNRSARIDNYSGVRSSACCEPLTIMI